MKILKRKETNIVITAMTETSIEENGTIRCDDVIYSDCTLENCEVIDNVTLPPNFVGGCYTYTDGIWACVNYKQAGSFLTEKLNAFAAQKDIDGIGEASALLNSANPVWKSEAAMFVNLWDATWQAFYNDEPLPLLKWSE
jgi:hypothetical protein